MKILFLGLAASPLLRYLKSVEDDLITTDRPVDIKFIKKHAPDFIVSYGYRHILKKDVLEKFSRKAINLHISFLPWNRGADPNFWSFVEDTPKGVSICYLDEGIDTGDIIVQKKVSFSEDATLKTSYDRLDKEIQVLFKKHWRKIRAGGCDRKKQKGKGSYHKTKDKEALVNLLTKGWNTPISTLMDYAAETQMSMQFWQKYDAEIEEIRKNTKI